MPGLLATATQFAVERQAKILALVRQHRRVDLNELIRHFAISPATARRDLAELAAGGLIQRTHGGAVLPIVIETDPPLATREERNRAEKIRIGELAATLVGDDESIFIDSGTTTAQLARYLAGRKNLKVVTNATNIWTSLLPSQDCEITLLGGQLRERNLAIVGVSAIQMIKMYGPTKAFIGVNAVDLERGVVCTPSPLEAAVQQAAIAVSQSVIVLADHTKFGRQSFAVTAALEDIDTLVTDRETSQRDVDRLAERGVRVMRA